MRLVHDTDQAEHDAHDRARETQRVYHFSYGLPGKFDPHPQVWLQRPTRIHAATPSPATTSKISVTSSKSAMSDSMSGDAPAQVQEVEPKNDPPPAPDPATEPAPVQPRRKLTEAQKAALARGRDKQRFLLKQMAEEKYNLAQAKKEKRERAVAEALRRAEEESDGGDGARGEVSGEPAAPAPPKPASRSVDGDAEDSESDPPPQQDARRRRKKRRKMALRFAGSSSDSDSSGQVIVIRRNRRRPRAVQQPGPTRSQQRGGHDEEYDEGYGSARTYESGVQNMPPSARPVYPYAPLHLNWG